MNAEKKIFWMGSSLKNLQDFPAEVKDEVGYILFLVQVGRTHKSLKLLKGIDPAVMEIVCDNQGNTYRVIYTIKLGEHLYVLHCFQKKSKFGIKTPKPDIDVVKQRLKEAQCVYKMYKVIK